MIPVKKLKILYACVWIGLLGSLFLNNVSAQTAKKDPLRDFHRKVINLSRDGKHDSAFILSQELVQLRKDNKDTFHLIRAYVDQMEILRSLNDIKSAVAKGNEVEAFVDNARPSVIVGDFYNRRSAIHYENEEKLIALKYLKKAQSIYQTFNDTVYELSNLNIEGAIYREIDSFEKALKVLNHMNSRAIRRSDVGYQCLAHYNLSMTYYKMQEYESAIQESKAFLALDHSTQEESVTQDAYQIIVNCYEAMGQFEMALEYLKKLQKRRLDSIEKMNKDRIEQANLDAALKSQELESRKKELRSRKKVEQFNYLLIGLSTGLLLMSILIVSSRMRQRNLKMLHEKSQLLNDELKNSLEFKNKLIGIVAHDIRNPLGGLSGIIALCKDDTITKEEFMGLLDRLDSNVDNVNLLLENLVNWVRSQGEGFKTELAHFESQKLVQEVQKQINTALKAKDIKVHLGGQVQSGSIYSDFDMLSFVIRNIMSNAVKFSHMGGQIDVELEIGKEQRTLLIKDYGVGMDQDTLNRIYEKKIISKAGTQNEKGTGLGLALCKEMLKVIGGKLLVESTLGVGTVVKVIVPQK